MSHSLPGYDAWKTRGPEYIELPERRFEVLEVPARGARKVVSGELLTEDEADALVQELERDHPGVEFRVAVLGPDEL